MDKKRLAMLLIGAFFLWVLTVDGRLFVLLLVIVCPIVFVVRFLIRATKEARAIWRGENGAADNSNQQTSDTEPRNTETDLERTCPKCKARVNARDRFCRHCGFEFNKRWYETKHFERCSFADVDAWFDAYGDQIEVISAKGNVAFDYEGIFFPVPEWHINYLDIRFYPEPCDRKYVFCHMQCRDGFLKLGGDIIAEHFGNNEYVYRLTRDSYNKEAKRIWCGIGIASMPKG